MPEARLPEIGSTVSIQKPKFDLLLARLKEAGFETFGPCIKNETLVYDAIDSLDQLPRGYVTEQEAGHFRLIYAGHDRHSE
jgi:hypothetical protein